MKVVFVLWLFFLYTIHALPTGEDDHIHDHIHDTGPYTAIRKTTNDLSIVGGRRFGSGDSPTNHQCAVQCAGRMKEKLRRDLPGHPSREGASSFGSDFDPQILNKLCPIYDATETCLNGCQNSQAKTAMTKALSMGHYMCHDPSFKRNSPCLHEVQNQVQGTCESLSKCGPYKTKVAEYARSRPTTQDGLKDMLKNTCQFTKCSLDCAKPTVVSKCGQSAQNDFQTLMSKMTAFLKSSVESSGMGQAYPRECDRVTAA